MLDKCPGEMVWDDAMFVLVVCGGVKGLVVSLTVIRVVDQYVKNELKAIGLGKTSCVGGVSSISIQSLSSDC